MTVHYDNFKTVHTVFILALKIYSTGGPTYCTLQSDNTFASRSRLV